MQVQALLQAIPPEAPFPVHDEHPRRLVYDNEGMTHGEQARMAALQAEDTQYVSLHTNGNGACGLHAPYGSFESGELKMHDARQHAANALRGYFDTGPHQRYLRVGVLPAIWSELARPAALAAIRGGVHPSEESKRFWTAATPALKEMARRSIRGKNLPNTSSRSLVCQILLFFSSKTCLHIMELRSAILQRAKMGEQRRASIPERRQRKPFQK